MKLIRTTNIAVTAMLIQLSLNASAQTELKRIDSLTSLLYQDNELNGNVLVAKDGKVIYQKSYGYADVATKKLNNLDSAFPIASVSKTFTSVAILQLKEKGKLKLDDKVINYLPDFPSGDVTIRHLMSHTSGLIDFQIFEGPHRADNSKIFTNADLVAAIKGDKRAFQSKPGERWSYSNTGFAVLALIVEKVSGVPFKQYLAANILNRRR